MLILLNATPYFFAAAIVESEAPAHLWLKCSAVLPPKIAGQLALA